MTQELMRRLEQELASPPEVKAVQVQEREERVRHSIPTSVHPESALQHTAFTCLGPTRSLVEKQNSTGTALHHRTISNPACSFQCSHSPRAGRDTRLVWLNISTVADNSNTVSSRVDHMLAAPAIDLTFDEGNDWLPPSDLKTRLHRTASVGNSWGVTSIGGGYSWSANAEKQEDSKLDDDNHLDLPRGSFIEPESPKGPHLAPDKPTLTKRSPSRPVTPGQVTASTTNDLPSFSGVLTSEPVQSDTPLTRSPSAFSVASLATNPNSSRASSINGDNNTTRPSITRTPTMPPRPRRRSSQQRVSLVAGRVSIVPVEPPTEQSLTPSLKRFGSQSSFLSAASSTAATPASERETFLGGRSITEFVIESEIGRGAYGLVKRAREMNVDGTMGPPLIIKQIIKSRILADCWKRHPKFGTIPIEIYVMSSISSTSYVLPPRRPWDPARLLDSPEEEEDPWVEGKVVKGHPNICQLLDFFEDNHYYYLVMPSTIPEEPSDGSSSPSDLFDLVEAYPQGLPPRMIRSYLGQIADALAFLHSKGIVHRDVKDENVVLGKKPGRCILIDFGSSGIVKRNGWDTFSGTLDYAGPEILRGERYHGKEQDVWAFGVVAFVLLIGECPFNTAAEAQEGLSSTFSNASIALDERCGDDKLEEGQEVDGGGALGDAAALVRACLRVNLTERPTFEKILESKFLSGGKGWGI